MAGKDGSTGHSSFSMPAEACEDAGKEWSEVEEGAGQGGAAQHRCRGLEFQQGEGTGLAAEPEIPREDASFSLAHAERLSSNKMT